jgi:hypothetical protein
MDFHFLVGRADVCWEVVVRPPAMVLRIRAGLFFPLATSALLSSLERAGEKSNLTKP